MVYDDLFHLLCFDIPIENILSDAVMLVRLFSYMYEGFRSFRVLFQTPDDVCQQPLKVKFFMIKYLNKIYFKKFQPMDFSFFVAGQTYMMFLVS